MFTMPEFDNKFLFQRNLTSEFSLVSKFENKAVCFSEFVTAEQTEKCEFQKNGKKYNIKIIKENFINDPSNHKLRHEHINDKIIKNNNGINLKIIDSKLKTWSYDNCLFNIYKWEINDFNTESSYSYFKLIIPTEFFKVQLDHFFCHGWNSEKIEDVNIVSISTSSTMISWNGIKVLVDDKKFLVYQLDNFFILECLASIEFDSFNKISRMILGGFGFITGISPMDYGYFFSYGENNKILGVMFDSSFISTYKSSYALISLNAYDYFPHTELQFGLNGHDSRVDELKRKLKPVTHSMFSKLCNDMYKKNDFSSVIFSILEANSNNGNKSLNTKGVLYSVILEMMTEIVANDNSEKMFFIKDEKIRSSLQKSLIECAQNYFGENELEDFVSSPIYKRLNNINQATNNDKLIKPFEILGISLTEDDKQILKMRNTFLHGGLSDKPYNDFFYQILELNFLINALVLKHIGYCGIILDLAHNYVNIDNNLTEGSYKELL